MGQNEATLSTHPARSETKKVTDKEPTRPVRNTRTWMKTTSYGKTKQHLFVGLLLGVIVLSTQAQALSIEQAPIGQAPICCSAYDAQCESCKQGLSEEEYCRKRPYVPGCRDIGNNCCRGDNAQCLSCKEGISEEEYCKKNPSTAGCEKYGNICCSAYNAQCESCKQGLSEKDCCRKNPSTAGCEKYNCCKAFTADCQSCAAGLSEEEYCKKNPSTSGCEKYNCCSEQSAKCLSCKEGLSEEEYCKKNPSTGGCEKYRNCCQAYNAKCESCKQGLSEEEYCKNAPTDFFGAVQGCEKYHNGYKPSPCCLSGHCNEKACNGLTYEEGGRGDFSAKCISCDLGISVEEFCRTKQPEGRTMEGCEEFCKKYKNRDVPGCEKYHRRGSLGEKDRDDSRQKEDRDDSRQQEDGGFFRWLLQQLFGG